MPAPGPVVIPNRGALLPTAKSSTRRAGAPDGTADDALAVAWVAMPAAMAERASVTTPVDLDKSGLGSRCFDRF